LLDKVVLGGDTPPWGTGRDRQVEARGFWNRRTSETTFDRQQQRATARHITVCSKVKKDVHGDRFTGVSSCSFCNRLTRGCGCVVVFGYGRDIY
jgi:hypothetical protein